MPNAFVKISGDGDNVQVLVVLKNGYSFAGMQDLYASVMVDPGWGFSVTADTPGFSLQANANVLEFSAPVPIEYQGQDFYLNGGEFALPDGESEAVFEGAFFQSTDWDDVVEEEPLQPLASFMQDHSAAFWVNGRWCKPTPSRWTATASRPAAMRCGSLPQRWVSMRRWR